MKELGEAQLSPAFGKDFTAERGIAYDLTVAKRRHPIMSFNKQLYNTMLVAIGFCIASISNAQPMVELELVANFSQPVDIAHANDDRLFVVEKSGEIRIVDDSGSLLPTPFLDIDARVGSSGFEQGLLGLAFHPGYGSTSDYFFVNYTNNSGDTVVSRFEVTADPNVADDTSEAILLTITQPFTNHNGGKIQFGPDGFLYVGMGDGGSGGDPGCRAQDGSTLHGKMLRLDVDQNVGSSPFYGIPAGNPFVGDAGVLDEIWATGLRNPWRFSFDKTTGDLWIGDVGQGSREEVNRTLAPDSGGANYGWKIMEGTNCYGTSGCGGGIPACNDSSLTAPEFEYATHVSGTCAVTGGYVYRGTDNAAMEGMYVYGDNCARWIMAYDPVADQQHMLISNAGADLYTFGEGNDGELYVGVNGAVYHINNLAPSSVSGWQAH